MTRPDHRTYYMAIAQAVAARADCAGLQVGAVVVRENRILSTGYNGTPEGFDNCTDGGCLRCRERASTANKSGTFLSGEGYDLCVCVHAEANALLAAARFGISVDGSDVYSTHQPCFGCSKELVQAGVKSVFYLTALAAPNPRIFGKDEERSSEEGALHEQLNSQQERLNGALNAVHFNEGEAVACVLSRMAAQAQP